MAFTQEQQRVFDWLHSELGMIGFAESYMGALHLLCTKPPGYLNLLAHIGRDLMNSLGPTIAGIERPQVQYVQLVDELQHVWEVACEDKSSFLGSDIANECSFSPQVCRTVTKLIDQHAAGRDRSNRADAQFFDNCLDYEDISRVPPSLLQDWKEARERFLKSAHIRSTPLSNEAPSQIEESFKVLHSLLYVAASSAFDRLKEINEILEEANDRDN